MIYNILFPCVLIALFFFFFFIWAFYDAYKNELRDHQFRENLKHGDYVKFLPNSKGEVIDLNQDEITIKINRQDIRNEY